MMEQLTSTEGRVIAAHMTHIQSDIGRLTEAVEGVNQSLKTLAMLESQQAGIRDRVVVIEANVARLDSRTQTIESAMPGLSELRRWVIVGILAGVGMMGAALFRINVEIPMERASQQVAAPQPK